MKILEIIYGVLLVFFTLILAIRVVAVGASAFYVCCAILICFMAITLLCKFLREFYSAKQ